MKLSQGIFYFHVQYQRQLKLIVNNFEILFVGYLSMPVSFSQSFKGKSDAEKSGLKGEGI